MPTTAYNYRKRQTVLEPYSSDEIQALLWVISRIKGKRVTPSTIAKEHGFDSAAVWHVIRGNKAIPRIEQAVYDIIRPFAYLLMNTGIVKNWKTDKRPDEHLGEIIEAQQYLEECRRKKREKLVKSVT